ncbi:MAG TPA: hypothetical protein VIY73_01015 [Polyangiaceae bacterium]
MGVALLAVACSSSSGGGAGSGDGGGGGEGGGGLTVAQACGDRATQYCSRLAACSAERLQVTYGDEPTCVTRQTANCTASQGAPSTGASPQTAEACAQAYPSWDCNDFLSNLNVPAACKQQTGSLAGGATCSVPAQCQSGFCAITPGASCGTCAAAPASGASCAQLTTCGQGLDCTADTQTCIAEGGQGASCGKGAPCSALFTCVGADNAKGVTGTCQSSLTTAGATCDPSQQSTPGCDRNSVLTCNTQSKVCSTLVVATGGQPCGTNDVDDQTVVCGTNGVCTGSTAGTSTTPGTPGTCTAAAAEGAACDLANGPGCLQLARCVVTSDAGTAGTCQMVDPTRCQ